MALHFLDDSDIFEESRRGHVDYQSLQATCDALELPALRDMWIERLKATMKSESVDIHCQALVFGSFVIRRLAGDDAAKFFSIDTLGWFMVLEHRWVMSPTEYDGALLVKQWRRYLECATSLNLLGYWQALTVKIVELRFQKPGQTPDELYRIHASVLQVHVSATRGRREESYATSQLGLLAYSHALKIGDGQEKIRFFRDSAQFLVESISLLRDDEPEPKGQYYALLACSQARLWELTGETDTCLAAIRNCLVAIPYYAPGTAPWRSCALTIAPLYQARWRREGKDSDLELAIHWFRALYKYYPLTLSAMTDLAEMLQRRAERVTFSSAERRTMFQEALELLQNAIVATPDGDPNMPIRLSRCGTILANRFIYESNSIDIDVAIPLHETAIELSRSGIASVAKHCAELSNSLQVKFSKYRLQQDIVAALSAAQEAWRESRNDMDRLQAMTETAHCQLNAVLGKLEIAGCTPDSAVSSFRNAVALNSGRSSRLLRGLGAALMARFEISADQSDVSEGIKCFREAIDITRILHGKGTDSMETRVTLHLARALIARFEWTPAADDLKEAIRLLEYLFASTDKTDPASSIYARELCSALGSQCILYTDIKSAQRAEAILVDTMASLSPSTSAGDKLSLRHQRAKILIAKYVIDRDISTINSAISLLCSCIISSTRSEEDDSAAEIRKLSLSTLAHALSLRAIKEQSFEYHDVAARYFVYLAKRYGNVLQWPAESLLRPFADLCIQRFRLVERKAPAEFKEREKAGRLALLLYGEIIRRPEIPPAPKVIAAAESAFLITCIDMNRREARQIARIGVNLLVECIALAPTRSDRLKVVGTHSNVPSLALALAILDGEEPAKSLQHFEEARNSLWSSLLTEAVDLGPLIAHDPQLATSLANSAKRIGAPRAALKSLDSDRMNFLVEEHAENARKYNEVLMEIRSQPGFEDFLQIPTRSEDLTKFAAHGPIAVVNISLWHAHVVLIERQSVRSIDILMVNSVGREIHDDLTRALSVFETDPAEAAITFNKAMKHLWYHLGKPVMDALGFKGSTNVDDLPSMWWVTTGWLNTLPIHAAGNYIDPPDKAGDFPSVMQRVVSSYIPSLKALQHARDRQAKLEEDIVAKKIATLVSMVTTPGGRDPLEHASREVDSIEKILSPTYETTKLDEKGATTSTVLSALQETSLFHCVSHGEADERDPTRSALLFSDHHRSPFDVRRLYRAKIPHCRLAYLSACEAAAIKRTDLKDEGIHIAAAMLMAGVPSVIATWWKVVDEHSADLAPVFYRNLAGDGHVDTTASAAALHAAVLELKERGVNPFIWSSYVHFGV